MANRSRSFFFQGSGAALAAVIATASVSVPDHRAAAVAPGAETTTVATDSATTRTTTERQGHFLIVTNTQSRPQIASVMHTWPY